MPAGLVFSNRVFADGAGPGRWRAFEVTTRIEVLKPSGTTRIWAPAALVRETPYQKTLSNAFSSPGRAAKKVQSKADGLEIISAEFPAGTKPVLTVTSRVATRNWAVDVSRPNGQRTDSAELKYFLRPTRLIQTDGIVKERAAENHPPREDGCRQGSRDL